MVRTIDVEDAGSAQMLAPHGLESQAIVPVVSGIDLDGPPLPRDHPAWPRDNVAISQRARELFARLKPLLLRVLTFWDHRSRSLTVEGRSVSIDPSGCYRIGTS